MPPRLSDMSADLDALYRAPLPEFVTQRNALATRLRGEQGKEAAAAVKALAKPSGTAWVVNQLFWRHGREFDALMKAGDRLRDVQQQRLAGEDEADMRAAGQSRQGALSGLMARVPELLAEAGLSASQDMRTRVSTTLEALSIYGGREPGPRAGRLIEDVDPPGFAALALLVPAVPSSSGAAESKSAKGARGVAGAGAGIAGAGPASGQGSGHGHAAGSRAASTSAAGSKAGASEAEADAGGASGKAGAAPYVAPKLRAIDIKRVNETKAALARAEEEAAAAQSAAKATDTARQKAETKWQDAKSALDEAQRQLDAAMDRERAAEETRDAARKAATSARQALDKAERTRDQAERAYQGALGR